MDQLFVTLKEQTLHLAQGLLPASLLPWVSMLVSMIAIATFAPVTMMYLTWLERKVIARMQNRVGPNRVGPFGLLQPIADGVKMMTKEDIVPQGADRLGHFLAPVLAVIPALMVFAVLPFGRNMTALNLNVGLLFFMAVSSVGTFAVFTGGWASRSKFSLLGAMRSVAQIISYEVPMVLAVVVVIMATGTLSTAAIVEAQYGGRWFALTPWGFVAFLIFFTAGVAEVNRTPFDMPEAESEIVAGFHTEYSGMKFALFYMGEFLSMFAISGLAVTLFLGGWQGPVLPSWIWFLFKTYMLVFVMIWFRGTFPRLRIDQLMAFAWKCLLPLSMINLLVAGLWLYLPTPIKWPLAIAVLWGSGVWLTRIALPVEWERRTYRFAD